MSPPPPLPPFLFRAASNRSRGVNTEDTIDPFIHHGRHLKYHDHPDSMTIEDRAQMIYYHIRWKYHEPSEFSSWSISILWVLLHAVRRQYGTSEPFPKQETEILIYVMDTSLLPQSNSIHNATKMIKDNNVEFHDIPQAWADAGYSDHEYLIHGKLQNVGGLWRAVTLDELHCAGLWKLFGTWWDSRLDRRLFRRCLELRRRYFPDDSRVYDRASLAPVIDMARCFGGVWEATMVIVLYATRKRDLRTANIAGLLSALRARDMEPSQVQQLSERDLIQFQFHRMSGSCPEVIHYVHIMRLLRGEAKQTIIQPTALPVEAVPPASMQSPADPANSNHPMQTPVRQLLTPLATPEDDCETESKAEGGVMQWETTTEN
ncbi:uncharacterized protein LTR77_000158 [Saxophila tyrrhenica]|uniref:DUF7587 domain-containing protein n=1 Tax=Saxophila tyrrhenica TaxID=1690608 RepID=A0AAV9PMG0_9PEZI|nr:hypothetical protein LTR77_000158 [Saxophila tyrrhenica]